MQVTVKIRVDPKPRANRPIVFRRYPKRRNRPAAEDPPRATLIRPSFEKWIPREPAPGFQFQSNALFVTDHRDQIARLAAAQHSNQFGQKTRREGLSPYIQLDVGPHWN